MTIPATTAKPAQPQPSVEQEWKLEYDSQADHCLSNKGRHVTVVAGLTRHDRATILLRLNGYRPLLEACKAAKGLIETVMPGSDATADDDDWVCGFDDLKAVIAAAEPTP